MKKLIIILAIILVVIVGALAIIPSLYKDDIMAMMDEEIAKNVNADVYFDAEKFDVSLLSDFPNLSLTLGDFGVIGKAPFEGDTLTSIKEFSISIDLWSAISSVQSDGKEPIQIEGIYLDQPRLKILVLEDGRANYDIAIPSEEQPEAPVEESESGDVRIGIKGWEITDAYVIYDDRTMPVFVEVNGLNHSGSGDFTLDVFDLVTSTDIKGLTVDYDGTKYFNHHHVNADATLNMDLSKDMKFTFKENTLKVNDFAMGFDGWFVMSDTDYDMDINFHAKETAFKTLLSLVPSEFMTGYESLETSGNLAFDGFVKGVYNEEQMPGFKINLKVDEGMFKYPDLPTAVNNIMVDMLVDNTSGVLDNMVIDISKFHMDLGKNPINGNVRIAGLTNYDINADVTAKVNLAELSTMFPMEGLSMAGMYQANVKANGVYSEAKNTIPKINAEMTLTDGNVKYEEYPVPMENINVLTNIHNETGIINDTKVNIDKASMLIGGEPLEASGNIYNMDDITYNFKVKGGFDFHLVDLIYPLEGMKMSGKAFADIQTSGKMSDIDAERYEKLPTSGTVTMNKFELLMDEYPPVTIEEANLTFNPKEMVLKNYVGKLGKSDVKMNGTISNYIAYALKENEVLKGNMKMYSKSFDVNEWMPEEEEGASSETSTETPEEEYGVIPIPKTIDFRADAKLDNVVYTNMEMTNMVGYILAKDGILSLKDLKFNLLGGSFVTNGSYNTQNPEKPKFDFDLGIQNLSFQKSYATFNTVQTFAPLAQNVQGTYSSTFKVSGDLGQDLMPVLASMSGLGDIFIKDAAMQGMKLLNSISDLSGIKELKDPKIKDVKLKAEIKDGKFIVKPFDVNFGDIKSNVDGFTTLDGGLNYKVNMDIPSSKLGSGFAGQYANLTGKSSLKIPFAITGTYDDPKVKMGDGQKNVVEDVVKEQVAEVSEEAKQEVKKEANNVLKQLQDTTKSEEEKEEAVKESVENLQKAGEEKLKELKIKNPFGKKKDN
ncbi:AsmA family protein [Flexithrix dorotheae]|uniref:AsmA family protein n=1 Tax=Flexithrix dorotheae TaxID=70993 RepID=UPI0003677561|nr:AsmA family protein [Flexithrix dorotheae]